MRTNELNWVASGFLLRDTQLSLRRLLEHNTALFMTFVMLYILFVCPFHSCGSPWMPGAGLWVLVFLPLFVLDVRRYRHAQYLKHNAPRFPPYECLRYSLMAGSESIYRLLLFIRLAIPLGGLPLSVSIIPFIAGYVVQFCVGTSGFYEAFVLCFRGEPDRPTGFNAIASMLRELRTTVLIILCVFLTLKAEHPFGIHYHWVEAFMPYWGLIGIGSMVNMFLLLAVVNFAISGTPGWPALLWTSLYVSGLIIASCISVLNLGEMLDANSCPNFESCRSSGVCKQYFEHIFFPWMIFFPTFIIGTFLTEGKLADLLHNSWFQPGRSEVLERVQPTQAVPNFMEMPLPKVMFQITATYYSRTYDPLFMDEREQQLSRVSGVSIANTLGSLKKLSLSRISSQQSVVALSCASASVHHQSSEAVSWKDVSGSILSARGSSHNEIVETDQVCFICFENPPDAVLLECGHAGVCVECALGLMHRQAASQCSICRAYITNVVKLRRDLAVPSHLFPRPLSFFGSGVGTLTAPAFGPRGENDDGGVWPYGARLCAVAVVPVDRTTFTDPRWLEPIDIY